MKDENPLACDPIQSDSAVTVHNTFCSAKYRWTAIAKKLSQAFRLILRSDIESEELISRLEVWYLDETPRYMIFQDCHSDFLFTVLLTVRKARAAATHKRAHEEPCNSFDLKGLHFAIFCVQIPRFARQSSTAPTA